MSWQIKYRLKLDFHLVFYRELRAMKISRCYHEEAVDATGVESNSGIPFTHFMHFTPFMLRSSVG